MFSKILVWTLSAFALRVGAAQAQTVGSVTGTANPGAVVWLEAKPGQSYPAPANTASIDQANMAFVPHVLVVQQGTTVEFRNSDRVAHNIFWPSVGGNKKLAHNLGTWPAGQTRSFTFNEPGVVTLLCNVHPEMSGYIVVTPTPYFTQADGNGNYTIQNVPAGDYSLTTWQEGSRSQTASVHVTGSGPVPPTPQPATMDKASGLGLIVSALDAAVASRLRLKSSRGLVVVDVAKGSFADGIGISRGDVILEINRHPVNAVADFVNVVSELKKGQDIVFLVSPHNTTGTGRTVFLAGTLNEDANAGSIQPTPPPAPQPTTGDLTVTVLPGGAQTYLDDEPKGTTSELGRLVLKGISAGTHTVRVDLPGYKELTQSVNITPGQNEYKADLQRKGPEPLTDKDIEDGLKQGVTPARMKTLVEEFGVGFTMNDEIEKRLRDAGADTELLYTITKNKR